MNLSQNQKTILIDAIFAGFKWDAVIASFKGISESGSSGPQFIPAESGDGVPTVDELQNALRPTILNSVSTISHNQVVNLGMGFRLTYYLPQGANPSATLEWVGEAHNESIPPAENNG